MQTENIYNEIKQSIQKTKDILLQSKDNKNSEVNQNALQIFEKFEEENTKELEELAKNQEWDSFTIAFYGETNAGKSTLIEALRIYFKEESKQKQEFEFDQIYPNYERNLKFSEELSLELDALNSRVKDLEPKIKELESRGFFFKIFLFLGFYKKEKLLKKEFYNAQKEIKNLDQKNKDLQDTQKALLNELSKFQDGSIIGDGRSDFTRAVTAYNFSYEGEKFTLLDVPGIEGNEKIVIDEINNATRKAHAIFYIKKEPTPPQKGDENKKGTLEKIKAQLNAQTEVYTLFNKPLTSPRALEKELVNENEKDSLKVLDEKMKELLKDHYAGHKELCAQLAFYALSSHLAPKTELFEKRQKFIAKFSPDTLLEKSNFNAFIKFLSTELISNSKQKIKRSNFNKALVVVANFIHELQSTIEKILKPFLKELENAKEDTCNNLDISTKNFINDLQDNAQKQVDKLKREIRDEMYNYIETDVKDSEFKAKFERVVKAKFEGLGESIKEASNEVQKEFLEKIERELEQYKSRVLGATKAMAGVEMANDFGYRLDINIDSGIDKMRLFGSLAGLGVLMIWNPIGWVAIGLTVLGAIVSVVKAIWKSLSSSYKKAQQKKAVDENLRQIGQEIYEDIEKQLEQNKPKITQTIESIKIELHVPIKNTRDSIENLEQIKTKLKDLETSIKKEMK
ncbi:hypothetical protein DMB92_06315 [Campylobacter sp. MIT 99-7217]|uniref:hypothetical protein n=1 Tax=Campylobacter sp. MIT 99-7217 TaxID=535091 RepID=UPI001158629A|nr:hypothetical protein [Campylobacter sp. MIT 99-7217]TQR31301.1 hypothetical protein DMB92_06315 [Campylobacter sp. MIT 99-7217]